MVVERDERPLLADAHREDERPMFIAPVIDQLLVPGADQRAQAPVAIRFPQEEVLRKVVLWIRVEQHLAFDVDHREPEAGHDNRIDQRAERDAERGHVIAADRRRFRESTASRARVVLEQIDSRNGFVACRSDSRTGSVACRSDGQCVKYLAVSHRNEQRADRAERQLLLLVAIVIDQRERIEERVGVQRVAVEQRLAVSEILRVASGRHLRHGLIEAFQLRGGPRQSRRSPACRCR